MSSQTQLESVQQQIEDVAQEVSEVKASLSAAKQAEDGDDVSFLRDRLKQLDKEKVALREKENLLLRAQQGGVKSLDEVSILAAATTRELQRLQQEEDSEIISCVASRTSFSKAYVNIRWLLDEAKEHKPPPSFDASCGPPADDMSTIWEKAEAGHPDDHEGLLDE